MVATTCRQVPNITSFDSCVILVSESDPNSHLSIFVLTVLTRGGQLLRAAFILPHGEREPSDPPEQLLIHWDRHVPAGADPRASALVYITNLIVLKRGANTTWRRRLFKQSGIQVAASPAPVVPCPQVSKATSCSLSISDSSPGSKPCRSSEYDPVQCLKHAFPRTPPARTGDY